MHTAVIRWLGQRYGEPARRHVHENVDVEFNSMADVTVSWSITNGNWSFKQISSGTTDAFTIYPFSRQYHSLSDRG